MMALKEGDQAPDFSLPASNGQTISLKDFIGKKAVVFFYPRDNTSGCTREVCSFRDCHDDIREAGATILGVSGDSLNSHDNFIAKHNLPFLLLSDGDKEMSVEYGAWGEKKNYGRAYMGMHRITYLIDERGRVAKAWSKVKPDNHGGEVLAAIKAG
ncbi:MAG: thioredoxin-dependent thiol peroxidase [Anaerolineales bacterium]|jgi:peroxiredoxin Q/BCP|nr:thioredoxin-dependent thiol peroxidase [Anaerolineales bacterium]MDP7345951.1 thioredoxin-dependent thiol peroxidase [Anaerolineales bacterium]MDP7544389.1 thioredoxin-dependent thiol peroxidase [Anaerolineales bacterium]MDP7644155.1 thioredoxin-dependent thiol peroxidase [Anaerolineales bacterium]HJN40567.1 thioredoxin-dependent thiol peroxidase [Anaerolineales bacterium]|tara:strand:- start:265 stop:732 length:468 start_codon:yes stop_codon:yes gene_type:complete